VGLLDRGGAGNGINEFEVATVSTAGGVITRLTSNAVSDVFGASSRDSSKIVFTSRRDSDSDEIYVMNANGSGVVRLTNNNAADNVTDWFSPAAGFCANRPITVDKSVPGSLNGAACVFGTDRTDLYTFAGTANQQIAIPL
jgi:hypothetical protein